MKITLETNGLVTIVSDDGKTTRTLTLEQYERHMRDPEFMKGAAPAELAPVLTALAAR
jgi:hypothetical protein